MSAMTWHPSRLTRSQLEERRLAFAAYLQQHPQPCQMVCQHFKISKSTFYLWRKQLNHAGIEGLKSRKASGRPRRLSKEQETELGGCLQDNPVKHGFSDATWTGPRVRDWIGLRFGVWYHPDHVSRVLRRLGFSHQKPEKRAIERNQSQIQQWIAETIPEIKKEIQSGTTLVFLDEAGFSMKTTTRKTWATRGKTPLIPACTNWEKLSVVGGLTSSGKFYQHTVQGACKGEKIAQFLRHLLKQVPGKLIVVLDNAGIHKGKAVQEVLKSTDPLSLRFLPPYAPELNPIEWIWAWVKSNRLGNKLSRSLQELKDRLRLAWQQVRRMDLQAFNRSGTWSDK
ncbi:IS630 family transposase [Deinococcus roseus]|uniref:IS630 family transposase n=1 Tax=Deinococcus roseus TaxID=392414 RepID=A0ABQ2DB77_9DEIO|nr:hypothetical protein GCM10008938_42360 [Deinococcus roseus]